MDCRFNCNEIIEFLENHIEDEICIFICEKAWINNPQGILVADNVQLSYAKFFLRGKTPDDWTLIFDEENGRCKLGFMFGEII